eukprot:Blabericola_migrator_1__7560@NODE_3861_length_1462_cov_14_835125_g2392_i0_p1_GENE_NODE_3861_length_1462_cov_14_835125_g2392_i0NODE_3861_length_1462_cov_14_835125_g2392_i0_p1_ORF_typecomplete_len212_score40_44DUF773/PF05600_12/0_098_NODE_3861_length_1462_cov_14_835125_g2392_i0236871
MGAAASCVERVGKRRPDGPLIRPSNATAAAPANFLDYLGPSQQAGGARTPASARTVEADTARGGRRRPTVSASVAQAEKLRLKASREASEMDSDEEPDDVGDSALQLRKERVKSLRQALEIEVKYRSGLFDKSVSLSLDKPCENIEWYTPGSKRRAGYFAIRDVARIQPQKKDVLAVDIQVQGDTHTFVFDNVETRNDFINIMDELKSLQE